MVALILIFLFATPRDWFRDQPKVPHVAEISSKPRDKAVRCSGLNRLPVNPNPGKQPLLTGLSAVLKTRTGKPQIVTRIEPVYDSEKELKGYMAFTKP